MIREGGVSRVLFYMVISLNPEGWSHRRLCDGSRLPALASSLLAAESEIAAGRIALFTPRFRGFGLCCSHMANHVPIWTVDSPKRASLAFTRHPCSLQPGLSSDGLRPSATIPLLLKHVHILRYIAFCKAIRGISPHSQVYQGVSWQGKRRALPAV